MGNWKGEMGLIEAERAPIDAERAEKYIFRQVKFSDESKTTGSAVRL